jgi:hypothetical protein
MKVVRRKSFFFYCIGDLTLGLDVARQIDALESLS